MEGVQTVDVSWLHHSQKDHVSRCKSAVSSFSDRLVAEPPAPAAGTAAPSQSPALTTNPASDATVSSASAAASKKFSSKESLQTDKPRPDAHSNGDDKGGDAQLALSPTSQKSVPKQSAPRPIVGRRNSWISSISSKFSSGTTPPSPAGFKGSGSSPKTVSPASKLDLHNTYGAALSPKDKDDEKKDDAATLSSASPRGSSFLSNAFRKLSSSGSGNLGKPAANGAVCPRRVMNVDQFRDRCKIPDLNPSKLRRVAFCVDVEIAGISRRESDDDGPVPVPAPERQSPPDSNPQRPKKAETKSKEASDKPPVDKQSSANLSADGKDIVANGEANGAGSSDKEITGEKPNGEAKEPTRKQEKKKRSEEERKERKERKRRQAVANGSIPLQLSTDDNEDIKKGPVRAKTQSHPTTDPVRIYRRCCQLRETPVLKRLVDQISSPSSSLAESPGTVAVLDLTNFPMTAADIATFSDWLAIVPVRKLILENCALTDDSVRSILAGLLAAKTVEQMTSRRKRARKLETSELRKEESFGVVERLSLKDNPKIGRDGWRHISLFLHLSKSLKALDLTGIPFPRAPAAEDPEELQARPQKRPVDITSVFASALAERFGGDHLEELLLSECNPTTDDVRKICDAAIAVGLRRFGFANNGLTKEGLEHVVRYFKSGKCEGLDLGGNNLSENLDLFVSAIDETQPLYAISFADCSLTSQAIYPLLQNFTRMNNLRFIDFSHNRALFSTQPDALAIFRRFLPKMPWLKRIHLVDVDLSPDHAIALAEILPECPSLSHLNILENTSIVQLASATDPASQEEACAVYASLMAAVRVSRTIIAVDIEVPSAESNEVVKALASQIVVYSLRNLEQGAMAEEISGSTDASVGKPNVPVPEILQHIVGHHTGEEVAGEDEDEPAPDEDYVIGGTGVVKALGVCLGTLDHHGNESPGEISTPPSGTSSPRHWRQKTIVSKKPRDMSRNLLESARKIRARIQSALVREDKAGNDMNYRRLQFLDVTLDRMIRRFEDQYPETRLQRPAAEPSATDANSAPTAVDESLLDNINGANNTDGDTAMDDEEGEPQLIRLSRSGSVTSLHSRAMTSEEGHIHRLGQNLRRDFLKPSLDPDEDGAATPPFDETYYTALREKLERLHDDQTRGRFESVEAERAIAELGSTVDDLWATQRQDSETFEKFKQSQIAAQINAGLRPDSRATGPPPSTRDPAQTA